MVTSWTWLSRKPAPEMRTNSALSWNSVEIFRADIAHGGAQAADQLVQHVGHRPLVGHLALDTFRHQLERVLDLLLEIAVGRAARHGADGAHAAIGFVGTALEQENLARRLVGAGKQRADHGAIGAGRHRFGKIAGIFDAAVGDHRRIALFRHLDRIHDRGELRHADTGDDARGADRARPDADLDGVGAGIDQRLGALGGGDIARHHLHRIRHPFDAGDGVEHAPGMAVRGVDDDEVDAGLDQSFAARITGFADRRGGGDPQPALLVLAGIGVGHRLLDVLHRDQADAAVVVIDDEEFLDAVLVQEPLGLVLADALAHRDQPLLGHQLGNFLPPVGGKAHVAVGEDADELAGAAVAAAFDHRNAGNAMLLHQRQRIVERRSGWMVTGFTTMPDSNFFTWRTCAA